MINKNWAVVILSCSVLPACATYEPFPASKEIGIAQIESGSPNCFEHNKYVEKGVFIETYCGGAYPASLYDNGVEGACILQFDISPDGEVDPFAAQCNAARDAQLRPSLGSMSIEEKQIAAAMFVESIKIAANSMSITMDRGRAETGRANVVLPMEFSLPGGVNQAQMPDTIPRETLIEDGK